MEQSKVALAKKSEPIPARLPTFVPDKPGWLAWLHPGFAVPVMALLLAVIGYQNLQLTRKLNSPHVLPFASVNVGTYGSGGPITTHAGEGFVLLVRIPPDGAYSRYTADLYNPAGKPEWRSLTIPASASQDQWLVQVPGANWQAGNYILAVRGVTAAGESKEVGPASFELQVQK